MNLVASVITRNELGRYLVPFVAHLQEFCDQIAVLDDNSTDQTREWLHEQERVTTIANRGRPMFEHEGRARQALLEHTLAQNPSHVIAIDADEFVTDGQAIRAACEADDGPGAWTLEMCEAWKADESALWLRRDGGWMPHHCPILYRVQPGLRIQDAALSCGREPIQIRQLARRALPSGSGILHFGWTSVAERAERHHRYVVHDGGKHHNRRHLDSIMWPDRRVRMVRRDWPESLAVWKPAILGHANQLTLA